MREIERERGRESERERERDFSDNIWMKREVFTFSADTGLSESALK